MPSCEAVATRITGPRELSAGFATRLVTRLAKSTPAELPRQLVLLSHRAINIDCYPPFFLANPRLAPRESLRIHPDTPRSRRTDGSVAHHRHWLAHGITTAYAGSSSANSAWSRIANRQKESGTLSILFMPDL
jgi:hypothetical protein